MSFDSEMEEVKTAKVGPKYINTAGPQLLKITGYTLSEDVKEYTGKLYIEWHTVNADGLVANIKMYRKEATDSDAAKEFKLKQLKQFLENAGADFGLKGDAFLNSVKDKKILALMREEEYVGKDKNNNGKPEIKSIVRYAWSAPENGELNANASHLKKSLSEKDVAKYQAQTDAWNEAYGGGGSSAEMPTPTASDDDDLPF
jgi:hypothetical protein